MAQNFYGQIDLAQLGEIVRKQPQIVKVIRDKFGKEHKYVDVVFNERQTPSNYGETHYLKVKVKKEDFDQNQRYYIGDFKPSKDAEQQERQASSDDVSGLPF